jgi:hypothetical protein
MIKYKEVKTIEFNDWDRLVKETYGRPYSFQQQEGCKERQVFPLSIPSKFPNDDEMNDSIPEEINGEEMGVKFDVWLVRDPKQPIKDQKWEWELGLFWDRNFYPDIYTLANDLYVKGLIEKGEYVINIDW